MLNNVLPYIFNVLVFLANDTTDRLLAMYENDCGYDEKDVHLMLYTAVLDQYRIYGMLEPMFHNPLMLQSQIIHQINPESQGKLISE